MDSHEHDNSNFKPIPRYANSATVCYTLTDANGHTKRYCNIDGHDHADKNPDPK